MIFMNFLSRSSRATGPKMRVPFGFMFLVNDHAGIAVKAQIRTVGARNDLPRADDHRVMHLALFHRAIRRGDLDVDLDDVADAGITLVAARHADVPNNLGTGVIRHIQTGTNLQHKI